MKRYGLTLARLKRSLSYDRETGVFIHVRDPRFIGQEAGFLNHDGYRRIKVDGNSYFAATLAWFYVTCQWPPDEVDHKNTDRADDRFDNLRLSTRSQNCANKNRYFKANRFGYKGVKKNWNQFSAVVCVRGKEHYLGIFPTVEEAARAYDLGAIKHHGEFARLNFPHEHGRTA